MTFPRTRRNAIIGALVVGVGALLSYRFVPTIVRSIGGNASPQMASGSDLIVAREVSAVATYDAPNGTDKVRFTLGLDSGDAVVAVKSTDALKGDATNENLAKFSEGLLLVIRGKKLSELTSIDRVGKSSLTTAAFNTILPDLQKRL